LDNAKLILNTIIDNIKSVDNYSLLTQTIAKNIKNDNNSLLFANLILHFTDKIKATDIEFDLLTKLYSMSLKSQLAILKIYAVLNLKNVEDHFIQFQTQISELKNSEKNENVLEVLNSL